MKDIVSCKKKRVKCFGKKQTKLVDTSTTDAFFGTANLEQKDLKKKPASEKKRDDSGTDDNEEMCSDLESSKTSKINKSLFTSFNLEPKPATGLKDNDIERVKPVKKVRRSKGRKAKRKWKKTVKRPLKQRKSRVSATVPQWSSILEHDLEVENNATNKHNIDDTCDNKCIDLSCDSEDKVLPSRGSFISPLIYHGNISVKLKSARVLLKRLEDPENYNILEDSENYKTKKNRATFVCLSKKRKPLKRSKRSCFGKSREKIPLKLKSLFVVLDRTNQDPNDPDLVSNSTPVPTPNSSFIRRERVQKSQSCKKPRFSLKKSKFSRTPSLKKSRTSSHKKTPQSMKSSHFLSDEMDHKNTPSSSASHKKAPPKLKELRVKLTRLNLLDPEYAKIVINPATPISSSQVPNPTTPSSSSCHKTVKKSRPASREKAPLKFKELRIKLTRLNLLDPEYATIATRPATPVSSCQNYAPYTSTPAVPSKKLHCDTLDLSAISMVQNEETNTKALSFEYSFLHKVFSPPQTARKSVKLPARVETEEQLTARDTNPRSQSHVERSIFLQSHTCVNDGDEIEPDSVLPKLLELCQQTEVLKFERAYDWSKNAVRKVGEGSYGEVFILTRRKKSLIIKVIAVSEAFSSTLQTMDSVYSEIKVSQCLNSLRKRVDYRTRNFSSLKGCHVVQGHYPDKLLSAFDKYHANDQMNQRPDNIYGEDQIFVILELEYGGQDLTSFKLRNAYEAEIVFKQIAISLAIAEETHMFEHRDLHLGNVLVQRKPKSKTVSYIFRGENISFENEGLLVTIIDFTFSRILDSGVVYYNDLAEEKSLFLQTGDMQFDVYRATKQQLNNQWKESLLYSNVLWLRFLLHKFLKYRYSRPSSCKKHVESMYHMKKFSDEISHCSTSALNFLEDFELIEVLPNKSEDLLSLQGSDVVYIDRNSLLKGKTTSFI